MPGFIVNEGVEHAIRAPELSQDRSVAYGFIYFTGRPEGALGDGGAFLVEGYDTAEPRFFVDTNHNLDFNDDEPTAVREEGKRAFVLTQSPDGRPQQEFRVRITALRDRLGADQIPVYRDLFESFLQRMGGKAVAPEHWYADQRLNILSTSTKRGELAFQIGVIDWNCNGSYADVGEDRVLVGGFEDEFLSCDPSRGATTLQEAALIQLAGQTFEVLHVDPAGAFVRIRATDRPYDRLSRGADLPDFELTAFHGESIRLSSLVERGRYLLLDFWGSWCGPCIQAFPHLAELEREWQDDLTVLGVHSGDHEEARGIVEAMEIPWLQVEATDQAIEAFLVDNWLCYVLVDGEGKIRALNTELSDVRTILREAASDR